jgi:hypothetical protein
MNKASEHWSDYLTFDADSVTNNPKEIGLIFKVIDELWEKSPDHGAGSFREILRNAEHHPLIIQADPYLNNLSFATLRAVI